MDEETKKYFDDPSPENNGENIELVRSGSVTANARRAAEKNLGLAGETEGQLTIDVYQTNSHIVVESTIAGVNPDDIDIEITPESVTIRGERQKEERVKDGDYIYQECFWGKFSRSIILPQEIDPDKSEALLKNGVLKIKMPKANREKSKKLKVSFV